jgi:hypothetical protein
MIKIRGKEVKNRFEEMNVCEFERVSVTISDENIDYIDSYLSVLSTLGLTDDELNSVTIDDLKEFVKSFDMKIIDDVLIDKFELNGYTYTAYTDEFVMKAKDLGLIEKRAVKTPHMFFAYAIAVLFKRDDLSNTEHYDDGHLKYKESLIGSMSVVQFLPYISLVLKKEIDKLIIINAPS